MCIWFESSVINLIWTKKLVLLYLFQWSPFTRLTWPSSKPGIFFCYFISPLLSYSSSPTNNFRFQHSSLVFQQWQNRFFLLNLTQRSYNKCFLSNVSHHLLWFLKNFQNANQLRPGRNTLAKSLFPIDQIRFEIAQCFIVSALVS